MGIKTEIINYFINENELKLVKELEEYILKKDYIVSDNTILFKKSKRVMIAKNFYYKSSNKDIINIGIYSYYDNQVWVCNQQINITNFNEYFEKYDRKDKIIKIKKQLWGHGMK